MNELKVFNFDGSGIRTLTIDDEPYFVGKDVDQFENWTRAQED